MREQELLKHIYATVPAAGRVTIGPGDDMALLSLDGRELLAAVDQLVDGVHVDLRRTPIEAAGRKAVARSVSDVAAMAARPRAILVTTLLPGDFDADRTRRLFDAVRKAAAEFDAPLIGGDIAIHRTTGPLVCTVTVLAEPGPAGVIERRGARVDDRVYVTGCLGSSFDDDGGGHHLTFTPRVETALTLAETLGSRLHAMIDLSDGLGRDLGHIATASGVRIVLDAESIPLRRGVDHRRVFVDGEDYELGFVATGPVPDDVEGVPVTAVGHVESQGEGSVFVKDGQGRHAVDELGWEHGR